VLRGITTALLSLGLAVLPGASAAAPAELPLPPRPLFWGSPLADPSVVHDGARWFAVGTGWRGGTVSSPSEASGWAPGTPLLDSRPAWALNGAVWAPDVERAPDGTWLAYYSIPVPGLPRNDDRCIGVATSPDLTVPFTPDHSAPLVCPSTAATPPAADMARPAPGLPNAGVIDPSSYIAADGRRFLLYRTQDTPSSIRIVPLDASGLRVAGASRELLRDKGVLENPVMVERGTWRYLLLSRGDFGNCRYRTVWRRNKLLLRGWDKAEETTLARRAETGICGPGGADYVPTTPAGPHRLYLHGWVCDQTNGPCESTYSSHNDGFHRDGTRRGQRVIYAARVRWTKRGPLLGRFVQGPGWVPPPSPWQ
jgi:arabinan endo-1,5-alpha-L-arabinosidase